MEKNNYREMSNEELEAWQKKLVGKGLTNPGEAHRRALHAVQHPVRREILEMLKEKAYSLGEMASRLTLDEGTLRYHLQFLTGSFYVTIQGTSVDLTPLGVAYTRNAMR
jgi:DNA-binding transcriptional ArsR family regulator